MAQDAVAHRLGEVEAAAVALEHVDHPQRLLVVAKAAPEALVQRAVERLLAGVAEGRVAEVVPEADRLGQVLVQPQRPRDGARDPAGLERVREPRAVVVALRGDEDLRLVLQPPEALRVHDPVAVALEGRAQAARAPRGALRAGRIRVGGERRQLLVLQRADAGLEGAATTPSASAWSRSAAWASMRAILAGARRTRWARACSRPLPTASASAIVAESGRTITVKSAILPSASKRSRSRPSTSLDRRTRALKIEGLARRRRRARRCSGSPRKSRSPTPSSAATASRPSNGLNVHRAVEDDVVGASASTIAGEVAAPRPRR